MSKDAFASHFWMHATLVEDIQRREREEKIRKLYRQGTGLGSPFPTLKDQAGKPNEQKETTT